MLLVRHPDFPCEAVTAIEAEAERRSNLLRIRHRVLGDIGALVWPETKAPGARTDGLWRSTCLEAFVRPEPGDAYFEANVSPSGDWAAYAFSGYREGMRDEEAIHPSRIVIGEQRDPGLVEAWIDLAAFAQTSIRVSLAAVIEERGGRKSYWALAHPAGQPDFHHADGFTLELAPV